MNDVMETCEWNPLKCHVKGKYLHKRRGDGGHNGGKFNLIGLRGKGSPILSRFLLPPPYTFKISFISCHKRGVASTL